MNDKKLINSWALYDWANSAYSLIITSAIFPVYYSSVVDSPVLFLGHKFKNTTLAFFAITISYVVISFLSPLLSGIADNRGNKKSFLRFYYTLGSLSCMALYFFSKDLGSIYILYGLFFSMLASIGFCGSIVFYNAYLPEIATKDIQDSVSAKGFAWGYIGSVLLLIICLSFNMLNDKYHYFAPDTPARISFLAVGIWWFVFATIAMRPLPNTKITGKNHAIWDGFGELKKVWNELKNQEQLKAYLASFFFFNMGVQTVMYLATYFASDELHLETTQLIITILIIQIVAIFGAWIFSKVSKSLGNYNTLLIILAIWIFICLFAYFVNGVNAFYVLAFIVGLVMGGVQSMSRSTYSKLLPKTKDTTSYFSFFDVIYNIGIVIGTGTFAFISEWGGGMRYSVLSLSVFFIIGALLLFLLKKKYNEVAYH